MSALQARHRATTLLEQLNTLRAEHGGDTYSMGDIRRFAVLTHGGGAVHRERFLRDWAAIYTEFGPQFSARQMTIQGVDDAFIGARNKVGIGPANYRRFVVGLLEALDARAAAGLSDEERAAAASAMQLLPIRPSAVAGLTLGADGG